MSRTLVLGVGAALAAAPASAHDFWIEPATFTPAPGSTIAVALRVGAELPGDPVPRREERIVRFALVGPLDAPAPDGDSPAEGALGGVEGATPAGVARVDGPGLYALVYRSTDAPIELPAAKFEHYLVEEGLERISELRAARGESAEPGRELYSRSVKALLAVGRGGRAGGDRADGDRPVGLDLELVAEHDPRERQPAGGFPIRLLRDGEPLAGALVEAVRLDATDAELADELADRSDVDGRVRFDLAAGRWRITAVDMRPAPAGSDADWNSVWTALTFEVAVPGS